MAFSEQQLRRDARRAYEFARWRHAIPRAWPALLPTLLAVGFGCRSSSAIAVGGALLVATVALLVAGGGWARGVKPGLWAGVVPLAVPLLAHCTHLCSGGRCGIVRLACVLGGLVAGTVLGFLRARPDAGMPYLLSSAVVAGLTGALGCVTAGVSGVIGMASGFVLATVPTVLAVGTRRA